MILDGAGLDASLHGRTSDPRAYLLRFGHRPPDLAAYAADAEPLVAEVNHGVWIARDACGEHGGVHGGGVVWLARPMIWCPRCGNRATGGLWRPVALPTDRAEIEAALAARPDRETRNWRPTETVGDLLRENAEHGVMEA